MSQSREFSRRHLGSSPEQTAAMVRAIGYETADDLIAATVPAAIRLPRPLNLPEARSESEALSDLKATLGRNQLRKSLIGQGYSNCITPPVIQRNILENPGWYTAYTPYQAEIAQGRLEALLNFQTMICDLTGLDVANASLLDEGTAAAEAMAIAIASHRKAKTIFVSERCLPQTIKVVETRAEPLRIDVVVGDHQSVDLSQLEGLFAVLVQYPAVDGEIIDYTSFIAAAQELGALAIVAADILSLVLLKAPAEFGVDVVIGNSQRFGVPLGFGGPHAAFIAVKDDLKRKLPGRIVGVSRDVHGNPAYRLSLQTREQHIRRDKATSNICTAQVLLAVIASMYAVYHGPEGLRSIAKRVHGLAARLAAQLSRAGVKVETSTFFDTITIATGDRTDSILSAARAAGFNLGQPDAEHVRIALDETTTASDIAALLKVFGMDGEAGGEAFALPSAALRHDRILAHTAFVSYHSETEMLRYLHRLELRDLALNESMIPLGSCTMKLNATAEMLPLSWPETNALHPFVPSDQAEGYSAMCAELEQWLAEITGFAAVSLQPNAGSQGEYAGLLAIRHYHLSRSDSGRNICLIPTSAHGTNPASAVMVGMKVVTVKCDDHGNIDVDDLRSKADKHSAELAALMVTYPSTHGVFEEGIRDICEVIHSHGGQVYMDGANMNAQVGLCSPGTIGADVCHLNLHKTFCIPHGGGGPGVGPIGVAAHLVPFLPGNPGNPGNPLGDNSNTGPVCSANYGSASILTISWMYIAMMGERGLTDATKLAIINANYIATRLQDFYPVLYRGKNGLVAHECIIDLRHFKEEAGIAVEDVAKRLIDYGYHAPTMSWPVAGTLMIEPTESESKVELDRFCDAMIAIHGEIRAVKNGEADAQQNVLKNAPHTAQSLLSSAWDMPYSRECAAYPSDWTRHHKFWPVVGRIDNVYGDKNLICTCAPLEDYEEEKAAVTAGE
jgi:glycine dehydrogenase